MVHERYRRHGRGFLAASAAVMVNAGLSDLTRWGRRRDPGPDLREHRVGLTGLAPAQEGLVLAHLTDLHVGLLTPRVRLERAVRMVQSMRPDLVLLTGDYLWHGLEFLPHLEDLARRLPRPAIATLGNHDHWCGAARVRAALEAAGVRVLQNERLRLELRGHPFTVAGIDDARTGHADVPRAMALTGGPGPVLALAHCPGSAPEAARLGARLILAGHTHGGALRPLGLTVPARAMSGRYLAGWYTVEGVPLYVGRGVGDSGIPIRLGREARPEVTRITLAAADR